MGPDVTVKRHKVVKKLGENAVQLLERWNLFRDYATSRTFATQIRVASDLGIPRATATRALARLRNAGLVSKAEIVIRYPDGARRAWRTFRARPSRVNPELILMPEQIANALNTIPDAPLHGGARRGPRAVRRSPVSSEPLIIPLHTNGEVDRSFPSQGSGKDPGATPGPDSSSEPEWLVEARKEAAENLRRAQQKPEFDHKPGKYVSICFGKKSDDEDLYREREATRLAELMRDFDVGFPAAPPPPTDLSALPVVARARYLATCYRGAVNAIYHPDGQPLPAGERRRKRCWVFARGNIKNSRHYGRLMAAAEELQALGIAPARWVAWSLRHWKNLKDLKKDTDDNKARRGRFKYAPVSWVFGVKRIRKYAEQCITESATMFAPSPQYGPLTRKLTKLRERAATWVSKGAPARRAMFATFGFHHYEDRLALVRRENKRIEARLREDALEHWMWVWPCV